jgi:5-methylthioribose kinase
MIERAEVAAAYRPFDVQDAIDYAATCPPLAAAVASGAKLTAREVGDGNLNLVFIVSSDTGSSAVMKQALPYVRLVGESWPLTTERNRFERQAYAFYAPIVPDLIPQVYHEDDTLALFIMEDLSRLGLVRHGLINRQDFPRLAGDIGRFCAETLVRSSDFYLDSAAKKRLVAQFINPQLCKITEDLVLTDPFYDAASNRYEPALQPAVEALWADSRVQGNSASLRYAFMTRAEALLHGDLHTGSVMANRYETKVMDAEFAFFGPIGFDVGMYIANLFLSAASHLAQDGPAGRSFVETLWSAAAETWNVFAERAGALLAAAPAWRPPDATRNDFIQQVLRDATGFAGAETIRRTIGLAQVADLNTIADATTRVRAKSAAVSVGRALIAEHRHVDSFDQTLALVRRICAEELP